MLLSDIISFMTSAFKRHLLPYLTNACGLNTVIYLLSPCILTPLSSFHLAYRDWVWSLLTSPIPETLTPSSLALNDVKEIETWILRLLSVPVPVPGKTKIEVKDKE